MAGVVNTNALIALGILAGLVILSLIILGIILGANTPYE